MKDRATSRPLGSVVQLQGLSDDTIWDIASFCYRHPERAREYAIGDEERFQEGYRRRAGYLWTMLQQGARAQIAYHGGKAMGFIEYYPIEISNLEVDGRDVMAIWCINVREEVRSQGIGSRLIEACLADAQALGKKGVVVTTWDPFWMPKAPFHRHGFGEVGAAGKGGLVLFRSFEEVEPPGWVEREPVFEPAPAKLALDIYRTDRCPIHWRNNLLIREVAEEFGGAVEIREHSTDDRADMLRHGTACRVYLNGTLLAAGPLADRADVRRKMQREYAKLLRDGSA